jgi:molybdenum cofactor cytidylyltransferase
MIPIVILAAGASTRLGKPKQNLVLKDQTLLQRMIRSANAASDHVLVVLGANFDQIAITISDTSAKVIYNQDWALGMSSSIQRAMSYIQLNHPESDAVMFTVCDQPFVTTDLLLRLVAIANKSTQGIIACSYHNTIGVPAIFKSAYFPQLQLLNHKQGAKMVLEQHSQDVYSVPFPLGAVDIDTVEDYNHLLAIPS